ncbi:hypothetical protein J7W19_20935 [Streptomyces mobaraensis NBRC 13819 = DSM 40847]|nr:MULTISPECIES: hypothetical protein [Streptomyces]MBC2875172.1 hypothetical protein [Streptomyces sp. TYQ1024]QTT75514.1 hypothetical protein J7W19_20935 [Streptomyces mobaraensis NBRC 13819 = DSM 40847]UBI37005.1 hypothetical protein K7I03_11390 [Streptomyces mobaraensis]UKW29598.1 hypothetical protein MCU78_11370 [Streptomyces sp. TYQ1024]
MPNMDSIDAAQDYLDVTDLDFDVNVPETDFTVTRYATSTSTCNSWGGHFSRCWNCN